MHRPSNGRYGLVWPTHQEDITNKDLFDFVMVTNSMRMPPGSGILVDVKDIYGRVFFPTKGPKLVSQTSPVGNRAVFELIHYAERFDHELFLGVPILHDSTLAKTDLAMVNADGGSDGKFICPANPAVQAITVRLLSDLAALAPDAKLFLPFFRYPVQRRVLGGADKHYGIARDQGYCFCKHCRQGFRKRFGYELSWQKITSQSRYFYDWLEWRCHTIENLARLIVRTLGASRLLFEMDLCPKRLFLNGIYVDNGHDIPALSKIFTSFLIHIFDRSSQFSAARPTADVNNDVMYMNIERIKKQAKVHLMMWNIRTEQDLQRGLDYASHLDVETRFFVLYPKMVSWLLNRIQTPTPMRLHHASAVP